MRGLGFTAIFLIGVVDFQARYAHRNPAVFNDASPCLFALPNPTGAGHLCILHFCLHFSPNYCGNFRVAQRKVKVPTGKRGGISCFDFTDFEENEFLVDRDIIQFDVIKLADGELRPRLSEPQFGLTLEKKLALADAVVRQKANCSMLLKRLCARGVGGSLKFSSRCQPQSECRSGNGRTGRTRKAGPTGTPFLNSVWDGRPGQRGG